MSAALVSSAAFAQSVDAPIQTAQNTVAQPAFGVPSAAPAENSSGDTPNSVREVVVTGSRIRSPSLTSASPLTVVGSQELKNIGAVGVEQALNQLPSVTASQNSGLSGLSNGTATVDLRDLGAVRTLVLVNGRRLMPGDPTGVNGGPAADINIIPSQLVDRVEVVTGGASAVYGSDAVAGVVNFIMRKNFQGVELDATENFAEHDNNDSTARGLISDSGFQEAPAGNHVHQLSINATAIFGANTPDDKGNITAYGGYRQLAPILESKYDYSACTISAAPGKSTISTIYAGHACGGSSNGLYGRFSAFNPDQISAFGLPSGQLHDNPNGSQSFVTTKVPSYNYGATNYFQRSETRYTAGYFANYEVSAKLNLYSEFMFDDDQTVGQIAPSGLFAGTGANGNSYMNINCNNPLLSAAQQAQLCGTAAGMPTQVQELIGYRFGSFPRDYGYEHLDYKINVGAKGQLNDAFSYDVYAQYGTTKLSNLLLNDTSTTRLQDALLVDPMTGQCLSGISACVPLNIFKAGGVTQDMFNYVSVPAIQTGDTVEQIVSASISGDLGKYNFKSPFANLGVGVAGGVEYRREALVFEPDTEYQNKDLSGTSQALPNSGSFDVYELFGEVQIPLVQNKPFVKDLTFNGGYRFSDYNTAGVTSTYKGLLEYAPTSDIRFRGGYNRAVRAPNVVELFKPTTVALFGGSDPCVGKNPSATQAECVATGLPANLYGNFTLGCPAGQCGDLTGGNLKLKPETADTYTAGFVITPTWAWARGLSISLDYFNIFVRNVITTVPATVSVANCVSGDLATCASAFHRDPSAFVLFGQNGYVSALNTNSGFLRTDGLDLEADYRRRLSDFGLPDLGVVSFNMVTTYTNAYTTQPVSGGGTYNCAGLYGLTCGNPLPKIRGKFRVTYEPRTPVPVSLSMQWRYVGPVHLDANTSNPLLTNHYYGITDTADNGLHSFSYLDFSARVKLTDKLVMNVGCNNLLDKDPPIVDSGPFAGSGAAAGNGNTYPGVYDVVGRTIFAELTADF